VRDITERKKAEAQVQQHLAELTRAWHANTLGEMASGLAHELNQPLCAILNYSSGCLRLTRKEQFALETLRASIEQIAAQAHRAADIIKHIRGLTGSREPQRTPVNLEAILREAVRMLQDEASQHRVAMVVKVAHNLPAIRGDTVEIEQVVLNLMRNALEAMSEARVTDRTLTITGAPTEGRLVEVAVADTGRGVAPELAEKIFESFFTTKREGLGIGLALSRRIVEAHGGRLWVESDGRTGATFRFTLPGEGAVHGEGKPDRLCGG
jgi:two-component system sensor kinase FixL